MYLVDTSVWIDYIHGYAGRHVEFLDELLRNPIATGISDFIYQEILQGAKDQKSFTRLKKYFSGQNFYRFTEPALSHEKAAYIYFHCRRKGITLRSSVDCLIAQCSMENDLVLFHNDKDYISMGKVTPGLKQKHFLPKK